MPSKSNKQRKFMAAVANNPEFANKVGVPQSVGDSFMKKDKMKKNKMMGYKAGGLKMVEKDGKKVPFFAADGKGKMMGGGKVMKYAMGDIVDMGKGVGSIAGFAPEESTREMMQEKKKKKKKKKMMGGGMMKYGHGGGVKGGKPRGCGMARQGVRNAKMVVMKGS